MARQVGRGKDNEMLVVRRLVDKFLPPVTENIGAETGIALGAVDRIRGIC